MKIPSVEVGVPPGEGHPHLRKFIDYKASMITDEDPLREWLFY